jgi:hypothetical protein
MENMKKVIVTLCFLVVLSISVMPSVTKMGNDLYENNSQKEYSSEWPASLPSQLTSSEPFDRWFAPGDATGPGGQPSLCDGIGTVCTCGCQTGGTCTCTYTNPVDPIEDAVWLLLLITGVYGIFLFIGSNKISFRRRQ